MPLGLAPGIELEEQLVGELHGGVMRIRSTLGAGTTVVVRLPLDGPQVEKGKTGSETQAA